jgi:hypothetical protein
MKASIEVKDRREADAIRTALEDQMIRASVVIAGLLLPFTPRARKRVLTFVMDKLDEDESSDHRDVPGQA